VSELQITGLDKSFGSTTVLRDLELTVPAGSLTAILGPSGSGKTTLLRVLAGLQRPDRGTITIGERTVEGHDRHVPAEQRRIGYVPQEGALFPHLTVQANVAFGLPRRKRRDGAARLLEIVGMAEFARRHPHQLSGGQQQRVALARALAVEPEIVLLDEPFASLDAHLRASVREQVHTILRQSHTTTVLVTHDQDEALSTADQVAVLRDGKIAQCSAPQDLYTHPIDEQMACFVGEANFISGTIEGKKVQTQLGELLATWRGAGSPPSAASPVSVLVRPEQIEMRPVEGDGARIAGEGSSAMGRIVGAQYHGHDSLLHVEVEGAAHRARPLIVRSLGDTLLPAGAQVSLTIRDAVLAWPI
jgi:iron(III) transport system ATP-binding protein